MMMTNLLVLVVALPQRNQQSAGSLAIETNVNTQQAVDSSTRSQSELG